MAEPRVLLVTKGLDLGGIERIVTDLAAGLAGRGADVEVAVVNSERDRLAGTIEAAGVALHRLDGSDRIGCGAALGLAQFVRSGRYDVVHVHGPLPSALTRVVARQAAVVTTSHTPWTSLHPATRAAWRLTVGRDTATLAVSSDVARSLPGSVAERTIVLPHGVDHRAVARALEAADPPMDRPCTAIVVASHRDAKNYPNLFEGLRAAIDIGAELHLVAVGEGDNLDAHRQLVHELGLDERVTFEPPTEDILATIAAADLLVVASDYEGQPIVVAEALALGKPVVATAVGRVPEMVSPDVGRVVEPRDPEALGAAIAELAGDPQLRASMSRAARQGALDWTLDDVLDAHQQLYAKALEAKA